MQWGSGRDRQQGYHNLLSALITSVRLLPLMGRYQSRKQELWDGTIKIHKSTLVYFQLYAEAVALLRAPAYISLRSVFTLSIGYLIIWTWLVLGSPENA